MESIQRYWKRTDKMYLLPCFAAHDDSASTAIALLNRQSSRYKIGRAHV